MQITIQITSDTANTGDNFFDNPDEAINFIRSYLPASYTFYHISGYECLRDGTSENGGITTIEEAREVLDNYEVDYKSDATTLVNFIRDIRSAWNDRHNDGGGSGWIKKD